MKWEKGDKVITPSGRVAEVTKVNRQGDVLLRYEGEDDTDLVTLRHDVRLVPYAG